MKEFPLVYIIILNWNSCEDTTNCINSCRELTYPNFCIILIDNCSTDDSETRLRKRFPDIKFFQTGANLGYGGGNNLAIRYALKQGAEFVWILNPDVIVEKISLGILIDALNTNLSIGVCGPRIIDKNLKNGSYVVGLSIYPDNGYKSEYNITEDRPTKMLSNLLDVDSVNGCSMIVRSKLFHNIGLLREDFLLYYDDVEFNFRARKHGWRTVVCKQAAVVHISNLEKKNPSDWYYMDRNRILLARMQKRFVLKTVIKLLFTDQLNELFKRRFFIKGPKYFLSRLICVLSGLLIPIRIIPRS